MTTIFSHALVPLATGLGLGQTRVSRRLMYAGMLASILPDFDTIGFKFGVAYASQFGHRGFSHSIFMAFCVGLCAMLAHRQLNTSRITAFWFVGLSMLSHGLLDMLTTSSMGVAILWPYNDVRYFFDYRPILASPIGSRFFTARGVQTLISGLNMVFVPALVWMLALWFFFGRKSRLKPN